MKRLKTTLFSMVPMLVSIAIQFFAVYYLLFIAAIFLFGIAPALTGNTYTSYDILELIAGDTDFNAIAMIIFSFCCIVIFGLWYRKRCNGTFSVQNQFHPLELLGILCLIPATQYLSSVLASFVSIFFPSWLIAYEELLETAGLDSNLTAVMFLYSVCMAPISEELIFRGVTLGIAKRAFPFWIANIMQAVLFGIFHMNPLQSCYTFVVGLILGYICEKGGSIWHAIFFHFLFNLWGTTAAEWLVDLDPILQGSIVIIGLFAGLILGFYFFHAGNQKKQTRLEQT